MVEEALKSGWETYLMGIPLIALLLICVFRLDELILKPRKKPSRLPLPLPPGIAERDGREIISDPDGRPRRRLGRYWGQS
jgi:hypothetical protein